MPRASVVRFVVQKRMDEASELHPHETGNSVEKIERQLLAGIGQIKLRLLLGQQKFFQILKTLKMHTERNVERFSCLENVVRAPYASESRARRSTVGLGHHRGNHRERSKLLPLAHGHSGNSDAEQFQEIQLNDLDLCKFLHNHQNRPNTRVSSKTTNYIKLSL